MVSDSFPYDGTTGVDHLGTILLRLLSALPRCKAETETQFLGWIKNQIERAAKEDRVFANSSSLTTEDVLTFAKSQPERKGIKPLIYEVHGQKAFIKLEDSQGRVLPWIVPANWLPVAQALWPCHVRRTRTGPYVNKKMPKQRLNGEWYQADLPVHHLFLNCGYRDIVDAKDGNLLNFTDGNLHVHEASAATKARYEDARPLSTDAQVSNLTLGWKPAKSRRVPGNQYDSKRMLARQKPFANEHEKKVWLWLQGKLG
jgi:hypothetical protein